MLAVSDVMMMSDYIGTL